VRINGAYELFDIETEVKKGGSLFKGIGKQVEH
jgi:hypothetical protein